MSFATRNASFQKIVSPAPPEGLSKDEWHKQQLQGGVEQHTFFIDADDLSVMTNDWNDNKLTLARLAELGGVQGLAAAFRTDLHTGLYEDEVEGEQAFERRKDLYGENKFVKKPPRSFLSFCWEALHDPMLIVLMVAGVVSLVVGAIDDPAHGWVEGAAILIAVVIVTLVGATNDWRKEQQFRAMDDKKDMKSAIVIRSGRECELADTAVVVGDIVVLRTGFSVPCDGVWIDGTDQLSASEAAMTGESAGIKKTFERPLLLAGTNIIDGEGVMLSTAVGVKTAWGRILSRLDTERPNTPLQDKLERMATLIGYGGAAVAVVLFLILTGFYVFKDVMQDDEKFEANSLLDFFIIAVTIVVVAVPEGLPLAVTISLAYSMKKMVHDQNFVRVLSACETMGNATTICSDKTGTLTQNRMTVTRAWLANMLYGDKSPMPSGSTLHPRVKAILNDGISLNSKVFVVAPGPGDPPEKKPELVGGNETECSLLAWALTLGSDYMAVRDANPIEKAYPFSSAIKRSSVLIKLTPANAHEDPKRPSMFKSGKTYYRMYLKGAAEKVIELCSHKLSEDGNTAAMDDAERRQLLDVVDTMTKMGLRCVAVAYKDYDGIELDGHGNVIDPDFSDFVCVAITGIKDPVRPEVPAAVATCQEAGIIVRMVTGDNINTARFIATECGILTNHDQVVMEGSQFRALTPEQMQKVMPSLRVLARSTPDDKEKLVRWYRDNGDVVAVTGDGANDALALKEADVGLSMGIQGTDVAQEASDIIIMDDNFSSIVKTVMWGRAVYDNIRKFVQFQLTVNVVALTLSLIGAMNPNVDDPLPLKAVQLLWVNLIMDTMAALALGTETPTMSLLQRKPYDKDCSLISKVMWRNILGQSAFQLAVLLVLLYAGADLFDVVDSSVEHYTLIFNSFVFMQVFNEINSRKVNNEWNVFENFFSNVMFSFIILITIVLQVLLVQFGGDFVSTTGLSWDQWLICVALGLVALPLAQVVRLIPVDVAYGQVDVDPANFYKDPNFGRKTEEV